MRILVFTTAYRPLVGGAEIALEQIVHRLPGSFFDIVTARIRPETPKIETGSNFVVHRVGPSGWLARFFLPITGFFAGLNLVRKHNFDLIHAYQASYGAGAGWLLKIFKPNLKFIVTLQEGKDLTKQGFFVNFFRNLILKKADAATAISGYLKKYALSANPELPVAVIPNGVDTGLFAGANTSSVLESLGIKRDERVVVSVSRLVPKNGLSILLQSIALLKTPRIKLLVIGGGPLWPKLKAQADELGIRGSVLFLGEIKNSELPKYLKSADVFVRPSISEGLGNAFLEAMAAGIPVVGTPVGGITDIINNGETGLLAKPGDPRDLADKIYQILSNQELSLTLAKKAKTMVEGRYDWQVIADNFQKFYDEL